MSKGNNLYYLCYKEIKERVVFFVFFKLMGVCRDIGKRGDFGRVLKVG